MQDGPGLIGLTWDKLREMVLESGGVPGCADEHVYKLAHVCHSRCVRNPEDPVMGPVYMRAVRTLVESDRFSGVGDKS